LQVDQLNACKLRKEQIPLLLVIRNTKILVAKSLSCLFDGLGSWVRTRKKSVPEYGFVKMSVLSADEENLREEEQEPNHKYTRKSKSRRELPGKYQ
jgi:hypothetical protein